MGTWGHHNAEMGTCGRGDMLVRLGPGDAIEQRPAKFARTAKAALLSS